MAMKWPDRYPGRWSPTSADYPQGKFKNRTSPTAKDGSFCEMDWANDWAGFIGAILRNGNVTPNGSIDTAQQSQIYSALIGGIVKTAGLRDVGAGSGQIPDMSYFSGEKSLRSMHQYLPGGVLIQLITVDVAASSTLQDIPFRVLFPNSCIAIFTGVSSLSAITTATPFTSAVPTDRSKFSVRNSYTASQLTIYTLSIGY